MRAWDLFLISFIKKIHNTKKKNLLGGKDLHLHLPEHLIHVAGQTYTNMSRPPKVRRNMHGGYYESGISFTQSKWVSILHEYETLLEKEGKCTVRMLAKAAGISLHSANRAIDLHRAGLEVMPQFQRGHENRCWFKKRVQTTASCIFIPAVLRQSFNASVWLLWRIRA